MINRCLVGVTCIALVGTSGPVLAEMDDIVVSATRRDESLQDVPLSISAFSPEQIDKLQIITTQDIGDAVPNLLTYTVTAGAQAMQVAARGTAIQNPGFNVSESPVGIYVDDVYFGRLASANLDLTDVERVEVLRGPQATLYGRNTSAGAIKIVTRQPGDEAWVNGSIGFGNFDTSKITASVGGPIEDGALAGSVAGSWHKRNEGWQPNRITGRPAGEFDNQAVRGKLRWYGGDTLEATLSVWSVKQINDGYNGVPYTPFASAGPGLPAPVPGQPLGDFYENFSPEGANSGRTQQSGGTLDFSINLNRDIEFRSITGYTVVDDEFAFDLAGGGFFGIPGTPGLLVDSVSDMEQISQEFHLLGQSFNERLDWIVGLFYLREEGAQEYSGAALPFLGFTEFTNSETNSIAVFGEGTFSFTDRLSATVGGRWTQDDKEYRLRCVTSNQALGGCSPANGSVAPERTFDEFTPKLSLQYRFGENLLSFASVSRGFKAGGFQTLCFGNLECAAEVYDPETVWSYEVGVKGDFFDNTLRFNANVFYAQYEDLQQTRAVGDISDFFFVQDNVGDVDVWGIELEPVWSPTENLNIFMSLGYQKADQAAFFDAQQDRIVTPELPSTPEWTLRAGADYTSPISTSVDLLLGMDVYASDEYFNSITNDVPVPSFARLSGFIGFGANDGKWSLVLQGRNITNSEDFVSGLFNNGNTNVRTLLPPREFMLTLRLNY